jgi:hypothetical protein
MAPTTDEIIRTGFFMIIIIPFKVSIYKDSWLSGLTLLFASPY